jgi:hypothetical protein
VNPGAFPGTHLSSWQIASQISLSQVERNVLSSNSMSEDV